MASITTTTATTLGGFSIPWATLRRLLPDERWALHGAGLVNAPGPAVVVSLAYQQDNGTLITIGSAQLPATGKAEVGPYPLRGPFAEAIGVPAGENIITVAMQGRLVADGTAATLTRWTLWLRMSPRQT